MGRVQTHDREENRILMSGPEVVGYTACLGPGGSSTQVSGPSSVHVRVCEDVSYLCLYLNGSVDSLPLRAASKESHEPGAQFISASQWGFFQNTCHLKNVIAVGLGRGSRVLSGQLCGARRA